MFAFSIIRGPRGSQKRGGPRVIFNWLADIGTMDAVREEPVRPDVISGAHSARLGGRPPVSRVAGDKRAALRRVRPGIQLGFIARHEDTSDSSSSIRPALFGRNASAGRNVRREKINTFQECGACVPRCRCPGPRGLFIRGGTWRRVFEAFPLNPASGFCSAC